MHTRLTTASAEALLAKRMGKPRIIAETGAGQHGVATATVCAKLGLECVVYMGARDVARQRPNVFWMERLGAKVVAVEFGGKRLKDAVNAAMKDWITNVLELSISILSVHASVHIHSRRSTDSFRPSSAER